MSSLTMTPEYQAFLEAMSKHESAGAYDVMYGGSKFSDFSDHPRKFHPINSGPNSGKKSSAAGKYQFLGSTWDSVASQFGIPDFTPPSQDLGAIGYAIQSYKGNLYEDLASGDPARIARVATGLNHKWTSLPGGIEAGQDTDTFVANYFSALNNPGSVASNIAVSQSMYAASEAGSDMASRLSTLAEDGASTGLTDAPSTASPDAPHVPAAQRPRSRPEVDLPQYAFAPPTHSSRPQSAPNQERELRTTHRQLAQEGRAPASFSQWMRNQS